ncbi:PepSY-associated TM helix domain-containing protein [Corticicoccus populi]|uniref:PepSY-associated TM helix domain-containing protein n=1 Tax=Corticicoccus populi TaxID=1812821 RepID=A0ABW5WY11_9STAP
MKINYNPFQRLHVYAAFFITPLLITLTVSGIGYLFYNEVEDVIYEDMFFGESGETYQTLDEGIESVQHAHHGLSISRISLMGEEYNNRVTLADAEGNQTYVFLDDNNQIVGSQDANYTYSNMTREFHSSLMTGNTFINYLVELTACWTLFMIISGCYMVIKKKLLSNKSKKFKFQKLHGVLGLIIAIPLSIFIITGLPWSGFTGAQIYKLSENVPEWGNTELSVNPPNSDVNEIPWATRSSNSPVSDQANDEEDSEHAGHHGDSGGMTDIPYQLDVEEVQTLALEEDLSYPFSIVYPSDEEGVFTVSKGSNSGITGLDVSPYEETTVYFDQYSGEVLGQISFEDYGLIGKWFTWGIPLHEGHLFGWPNKVLNLAVCLAFLSTIFFGFYSMVKRSKEFKNVFPKRTNKPLSWGTVLVLAFLGVLMPLFGISLIVIAIIEFILIKRKRN